MTLLYGLTTSFHHEDVYDDYSGTDLTCHKYDIRYQGVIDIKLIDAIAPAFAGITTPDSATVIMKAIRKALMEPRRFLSFSFNGYELIPGPTAGNATSYNLNTQGNNIAELGNTLSTVGTVDVKNGPMPQSCTYQQLTDTTFLLTYHIIAHYWENLTFPGGLSTTNNPGHPALYNRWTETVEIDNTMQSRRIREGKYIIRSDNTEGKTADELRSQLAVVGIPTGWTRESARYTISPDGLGLSYYIVDKELNKRLPPGVYEASGSYTESSPKFGAIVWGEVNLKLKGAPQTNFIVPGGTQADLVRTGLAICREKLRRRGWDANKFKGVPEQSSITVDMYENIVHFNMRTRLTAQKARKYDIAAFTGDLCSTPLSDDGNSAAAPLFLDRGSYGLLLQAAKYWDPDLSDTSLAPANIVDPSGTETTAGDTANVQHNNGVLVGQAGVVRET